MRCNFCSSKPIKYLPFLSGSTLILPFPFVSAIHGRAVCTCVLGCFSHVRLFATLWTTAHQAPLSMGFSRQEYWIGLPFPSPGNLPDSGLNPRLFHLLHWQLDSLPLEHLGIPGREVYYPDLFFKKIFSSWDFHWIKLGSKYGISVIDICSLKVEPSSRFFKRRW